MSRVRVKICGVTNAADAEVAIAAGADALGFNLYPDSKRHVAIEDLSWVRTLPPLVNRVAVLVNAPPDLASDAADFFDTLQFHGYEEPDDCLALAGPRSWIKALALGGREEFAQARVFAAAGAAAILVDAFVPGEFGGTGKLINLPLAAELVQACPGLRVILSGGLTPDNVAEAVQTVRPYAVDVASGVEMTGNPRRKDAAKLHDFIAAVRMAESSLR